MKGLAAASTALVAVPKLAAALMDTRATAAEIHVTPVSLYTFRLTIFPDGNNEQLESIPSDGSLVETSYGAPIAKLRADTQDAIAAGSVRLKISFRPLTVTIAPSDPVTSSGMMLR